MAERRMFSKSIINSDAFLDMPVSSQCLYFHLGMAADDDGFVNRPKSIMRSCSCHEDDLKLLISKKFIIAFESGVIVIKHWKMHNTIKKDRYKETNYKSEKKLLQSDENGAYRLMEPIWNQSGTRMEPQVRLGEDSIGEDSIGEDNNDDDDTRARAPSPVENFTEPVENVENLKLVFGKYRNVLLTQWEYDHLTELFDDANDKIEWLSYYLSEHPEKHYSNHHETIIRWETNKKAQRALE